MSSAQPPQPGAIPAIVGNSIGAIDEERYPGEAMVRGWDEQSNQVGIRVRAGTCNPGGLMAPARYLGSVR